MTFIGHGLVALSLLAGASFASAQASAQSSAQPATRIQSLFQGVQVLKLYERPDDARPKSEISAREVTFPIDVLEVQGDFLRVRLARGMVWVDAMDVVLDKALAFDCYPPDRKPTKTASISGASKGCK